MAQQQQAQYPYIDPTALSIATDEYGSTGGVLAPPPPPPVKKLGEEQGTSPFMGGETPAVQLNDRLAQDALKTPDVFGGTLPSERDQAAVEMEQPQREIPVTPAGVPQIVDPFPATPGVTAPPKPTPNQIRENLLRNDPVGFAQQGGVVKDASELSKLQGAVLKDKEDQYLAEREANKVAGGREIAKQNTLLQIAEQNANEYFAKARDIDNVTRMAIQEQKKQADELAKKHIDPSRAFTNMGTFGNVIWVLSMLAASQTKNSAQNMGMLMNAANNMVDRDIAAQKADLSNQWKGWEENAKLNEDEHKLNLKELADYASQKQVRYQMLEKAIDLKIAAMGNEAADRAGLLRVKAMLGEEVVKSQGVFQDQAFRAGESAKGRANEVYLTRLRNANAIALKQMDIDEERLKAKAAKEDKANEKGIPVGVLNDQGVNVGASTGLYATDKATGNKSAAPLQARDKDEAVKAMTKVNAGNERHSALLIIRDELGKMSDTDVASQHYSPRFMAAMEQLGYAQAALYNKIVTDKDKAAGDKMVAGLAPIEDDSIFGHAWRTFKAKGDTVDGMRGVVDAHLASEEKQVTDSIKEHLDRNTLQKYDFTWKPENIRSEPAKQTKTTAETLTEYGAGRETVGKANPVSRQVYDKDTVDKIVNIQGPGAEGITEKYRQEKAAGTLPQLANPKEDKALEQFESDVKNSTPQRIVLLANGIIEGKAKQGEPFSDEARFRLIMEARDALKEANAKQVKVIGEGIQDVSSVPTHSRDITLKNPNKDWGENVIDYLNSDDWRAAKKKYGIRDIKD